MRISVRSVGGLPSSGCCWWKSVMGSTPLHAASFNFPSITTGSDRSAARADGRGSACEVGEVVAVGAGVTGAGDVCASARHGHRKRAATERRMMVGGGFSSETPRGGPGLDCQGGGDVSSTAGPGLVGERHRMTELPLAVL